MFVLLSPSKTLDFECKTSGLEHTKPFFIQEIEQLIAILRQYSPQDIGELMKISEKLSNLNFERFQNFELPFTSSNSKECIFAFRGNVYDGLDADSLSTEDLKFAQQSLRILSGLYGILKPLDLMQPYRLEMGTKLQSNEGTNLYQFWGDKLAKQLSSEASSDIINLASEEYFKAVDKKAIKNSIINVHFKESKSGKLKVVGIHAKKARGLMARYIIKNKLVKANDIKSFNESNYNFMPELSSTTDLVFAR